MAGKYTLLAISAVAVVLSGCASRASGIAPMSISANEYSGMTCDDTRAALEVARTSEIALSRQQNNAATIDAAGVFLFLVPVGSVFGGNVEGELAQVKGEALALTRAERMHCSGAPAADDSISD